MRGKTIAVKAQRLLIQAEDTIQPREALCLETSRRSPPGQDAVFIKGACVCGLKGWIQESEIYLIIVLVNICTKQQ